MEVSLDAAPFEIRVSPVAKDFPVRITAWTDDSIFAEVQVGREISAVPFFQPGTGPLAGTTRAAKPYSYII